ncbi:hypothetical protein APA_5235 [Pseudanabaena sp. lw0831]|uniref:hypothetical protein n=1 Tax=Pseudanabaena sp. lw0831 TaxID=1357935 RepID=UPI001915FCC1|nr:hypothetical protein [Pseudanabaena sp. lw0831]GBO52145.1 hypothetical protein APA_5235 [Pseudanabaena sp. lw0831]
MIVLDTHIWIWWVHGDPKLSQTAIAAIQSHESELYRSLKYLTKPLRIEIKLLVC